MVIRVQSTVTMFNVFLKYGLNIPSSSMTKKEFHSLMSARDITLDEIRSEMTLHCLAALMENATLHLRVHYCSSAPFMIIGKRPGCGCLDHTHFYPHVTLVPSGDARLSESSFQTTDLLFVSCGTPYKTGIGVRNLVNVFDTWTWLILILLLITLSFVATWAFLAYYGT